MEIAGDDLVLCGASHGLDAQPRHVRTALYYGNAPTVDDECDAMLTCAGQPHDDIRRCHSNGHVAAR